MGNKINDPIARLMGLRYKSHPWHGIEVGCTAPEIVTAFIEMVPTDTVKYELDKVSGYIRIDRPQKYSTVVPALYGFIPQSFCGDSVAKFCMERCGRSDILGDGDPLDVCVLTERPISHGDITELPHTVVERLKHYFLTYKDMPASDEPAGNRSVEIVSTYGREEAYEVINRSLEDYKSHFESLEEILRHV